MAWNTCDALRWIVLLHWVFNFSWATSLPHYSYLPIASHGLPHSPWFRSSGIVPMWHMYISSSKIQNYQSFKSLIWSLFSYTLKTPLCYQINILCKFSDNVCLDLVVLPIWTVCVLDNTDVCVANNRECICASLFSVWRSLGIFESHLSDLKIRHFKQGKDSVI